MESNDKIVQTNMNEYVSEELRKKWCNYEFQGKPIKLTDGKTYMRAFSKCFQKIHFYCFEDDWFWHDRPVMKTKKDENDLSSLLT